MILTEHGKDFLNNPELYKDFALHTLVNIVGTEIIKDNKIMPICTYYLESDDGDVLFIADYCTPKEAKELEEKINQELNIKINRRFEIKENASKEKDQEMIKYIAYSNPDIRSVLFTGNVNYQGNEVSINGSKLLLNNQETSPRHFLTKLFSPNESAEEKIKLTQEIEKKRLALLDIIHQLVNIANTLQNDTVIPKMIYYKGDSCPAVLFKTEYGRYNAIAIGEHKPEVVTDIKIAGDCSWSDISNAINNNQYINNTKDDIIEKLLERTDLGV